MLRWRLQHAPTPVLLPPCPSLRSQEEVEAELAAAHRFITDRELEAPERFQAIQSYR